MGPVRGSTMTHRRSSWRNRRLVAGRREMDLAIGRDRGVGRLKEIGASVVDFHAAKIERGAEDLCRIMQLARCERSADDRRLIPNLPSHDERRQGRCLPPLTIGVQPVCRSNRSVTGPRPPPGWSMEGEWPILQSSPRSVDGLLAISARAASGWARRWGVMRRLLYLLPVPLLLTAAMIAPRAHHEGGRKRRRCRGCSRRRRLIRGGNTCPIPRRAGFRFS
ncbi:unnamed protein product [Acanthosepion pharaonis]|uniref:Uncharacterized protein n=1 Tax=Acanthosepion pharaonis TaxID=158019 RepID=A0A812DND8_ACAPH|nr:unnamed protein product [Sepia pharaonis]